MTVESEDVVSYRRDSSFVKSYNPPADDTPTADITLENQEVETQDPRPSRTIGPK